MFLGCTIQVVIYVQVQTRLICVGHVGFVVYSGLRPEPRVHTRLDGTRLVLVVDRPNYQPKNTKIIPAVARSKGLLIYANNTCICKILRNMCVKKLLRRGTSENQSSISHLLVDSF